MKRLIAILGPTAAGKTSVAIDVASRIEAEIVSVDSMQVYRGMDIGTAKPNQLERDAVPHHMIDLVDPDEEFTVAEFRRIGREVLASTERAMIVCGGSGLHFRSLVDPMSFAPTDRALRAELEASDVDELRSELLSADPQAGTAVDMANGRRVLRAVEILRLTGETPSGRSASSEAEEVRRYVPELEFTAVGIDPGELLDERIDARLEEMREGGLVEEVSKLAPRLGRTARSAVGYRDLLSYVQGEVGIDEAFANAARGTKRLAKKQRTWFQRDPRIRWIPWLESRSERVERVLEVIG